jgi:hypothetical protein
MSSAMTIVSKQEILKRLDILEAQAKSQLLEVAGMRDLLSADVSTSASFKSPGTQSGQKRGTATSSAN